MADATLERQNGIEGSEGQRLQLPLLCREGLRDDPLRRAVQPHIGDVEPVPKLIVEVLEVAERARQEEVLADVAERPLDFTLRLRR